MARALSRLQDACAAPTSEHEVVRVKQRFENPTPAGWADIFVNVRSKKTGYTAELQFVHEKLVTCRKGRGSARVRCELRGCWAVVDCQCNFLQCDTNELDRATRVAGSSWLVLQLNADACSA